MRTIIISDLHLTTKFDKKLFSQLVRVIKSADRVIINGDFWENSQITFEEFLQSEWNMLFPLLKSKTIYIYGNHDREVDSDRRCLRFCQFSTHVYKFKQGNRQYIVEHGHKDTFVYKFGYPLFRDNLKLIKYITYPIHILLLISESLSISFNWSLFSFMNKKFRNHSQTNTVYITGHTHSPEFNLKKGYINSGFIKRGLLCYVEITSSPQLIREYY